jgi:hypothetical protein
MKYISRFYKLGFTLVLASFLLAACNMAKFNTLPGTRIANTPQNLMGIWGGKLTVAKGGIDTFTINILPNSISVRTSYNYHELQLDKDYVINSLGKYYVIGLNDPNFKTLKNMILLEETKNGFKIYPVTEANMPFDGRLDLEEVFESRYFYSSNEAIDLPPATTNTEFDNQINDKVRNHYYLMDESRIEGLINSRFRDKNFVLMSKPKISMPAISKPKSSKK